MWPLKVKGQVQTPKTRRSSDKIIHLDFGRKTGNIIIKTGLFIKSCNDHRRKTANIKIVIFKSIEQTITFKLCFITQFKCNGLHDSFEYCLIPIDLYPKNITMRNLFQKFSRENQTSRGGTLERFRLVKYFGCLGVNNIIPPRHTYYQ